MVIVLNCMNKISSPLGEFSAGWVNSCHSGLGWMQQVILALTSPKSLVSFSAIISQFIL